MPHKSQFMIIIGILAILLGGLWVAESRAAFNPEINYQGKLTDTAGDAVTDGDYNFKFQLCTDSACAASVWTETHETTNKITVTSGIFSVLLGNVTSIASVDFNDELWLEVQVGGTGSSPSYETLTPRKKLGAVAAAFEADKLDGIDSLSFLRSDASDSFTSGTLTFSAGTTLDLSSASTSLPVISTGVWEATDIGVAHGGTGASDAATARINLGFTLDNIGDPTASSTIEIASTTWTIDSAGASSTFVIDGDAGNVGIGAATPTDKLTIREDSAGATIDLLRLENLGTATVDTAIGINLYANRTTGGSTNFAGIDGTITSIDNTNYAGKLDFNVAQNGSLATLLTIGNPNVEINAPLAVTVGGDVGIDYDLQFLNTGTSYITSEGPLRIEAGDANHAENLTLGTQGTGDVVIDVNDATATSGGLKVLGSAGYVLNVAPNGIVDLLDSDVAHGFETVASSSAFARFTFLDGSAGGLQLTGLSDDDAQALSLRGIVGSSTTSAAAIKLVGVKSDGATSTADLAATEIVLQIANNDDAAALTILGDGKIGVGTSTPSQLLHVFGGAGLFEGPLAIGSQQTMTADAATSSVSAASHFVTANTASTTVTNFTDGIAGQIIVIETGDANTTYDCTTNPDFNCGTADIVAETGNVLSWIYDGTVWNLINWMNTLAAQTGADIAEFFPSNQDLRPGDLVAVDATRPVTVRKTTQPHDKQMIGIISTDPGITLGDEQEGSYAVALAGRVPVKVSLENGPIQVGDLITSSGEEGVGMKATGMGRTIGYALEPFDGTVEVCIQENPNDKAQISNEALSSNDQNENSGTETEQDAEQTRNEETAEALSDSGEPGPTETLKAQAKCEIKETDVAQILVFVDPSWSPGSFDMQGLLAGVWDESASSTASSTQETQEGFASQFMAAVRGAIESFTGTIKTAGNWVFDKITAKTARIEKLELVDQQTGQAYCTWIENGEWVKVAEECEDGNPNDKAQSPNEDQNSNNENDETDETASSTEEVGEENEAASSTEETASSTPEVEEGQTEEKSASSTPPTEESKEVPIEEEPVEEEIIEEEPVEEEIPEPESEPEDEEL